MTPRICGVFALVALTVVVASADDNWPRFRGAQGGVATDDPRLPDSWGPSQNIVGKVDVPGRSWSSPIVWGDHVFVTTAINAAEDSLRPVSAYVSRSNGGKMTFRDIATPSEPHRWMVYDVDFKNEMTLAAPAIAHGGIIVRTASKLYPELAVCSGSGSLSPSRL